MDLSDLAAAIWRRRWLVVAVVVCTTALAAGFALLRTSRYESSAVLAITPSTAATGGLLSSNDLNTLMGTYAQTAKSSAIRDRAAEALGRPLGAEIDTSVRSGTGILRITASATDPVVAADAAHAVADAFAESVEANGSINASTIEPSRPATSPANPRVGLVVALGAALGLFGGVVLALVVDRARPRLVDSSAVATLGAPILGRIPHQSPPPAPLRETEDAAMEAVRDVRTELAVRGAPAGKVLEVVGAVQGTGASTVAANLAVAFARIGVETVLVDADLRRPCQHSLFGLDNASGLSAALAGEEPKLQVTMIPRLRVLTAGPTPVAPTDSLHAGVGACIDGLRSTGALVVVDSPPMLDGNDARLVAQTVDGVVLVAGHGAGVDGVRIALDHLATTGAELIGIVLSGDRSRR